jgi:hypothetical protein
VLHLTFCLHTTFFRIRIESVPTDIDLTMHATASRRAPS